MAGSFRDEVLGEILETGKAAGQQLKQISPAKIISSALEQVTGISPSSQNDAPPGLEDLKGKKFTPQQMQQMRQNDSRRRDQEIDKTRISLKRLIIQRYQQMQQALSGRRKEEEEALVKQREEMEEVREKEAKQQEQAQPVHLPKGRQTKGILGGIAVKQQRGTGEIRTAKIG